MCYELFTDGGCWPNPGDGGWAFILRHLSSGETMKMSGGEMATTNNRVELRAVIEGLGQLPTGSSVNLYSDSQYVVKGIMMWRHSWKKKQWKYVMNPDLWQELDALLQIHEVTAFWIRGHDGHPENEECDRMCEAAQIQMKKRHAIQSV